MTKWASLLITSWTLHKTYDHCYVAVSTVTTNLVDSHFCFCFKQDAFCTESNLLSQIFWFSYMIMISFYLKTSQRILNCGINKRGLNLRQQEGAGPRLRAAARSTKASDCGLQYETPLSGFARP